MSDGNDARSIIGTFWATMNTNDFRAVGELLHDDYLLEWPQSGERIRGRENWVEVNANYPAAGRWQFTVHRVVAQDDLAVTEVTVTDGARKDLAVTFSTVRDGKIWRQTEYWPEPFAAASWRAAWVERT